MRQIKNLIFKLKWSYNYSLLLRFWVIFFESQSSELPKLNCISLKCFAFWEEKCDEEWFVSLVFLSWLGCGRKRDTAFPNRDWLEKATNFFLDSWDRWETSTRMPSHMHTFSLLICKSCHAKHLPLMQCISSLWITCSMWPHGRPVECLLPLRCSQKSQGKIEADHNVRAANATLKATLPTADLGPQIILVLLLLLLQTLQHFGLLLCWRKGGREEGEGQTCSARDWVTLPAESSACWGEQIGGRTLNCWHNSFHALRSGGIWEQGPKMCLCHVVAKLQPFWWILISFTFP